MANPIEIKLSGSRVFRSTLADFVKKVESVPDNLRHLLRDVSTRQRPGPETPGPSRPSDPPAPDQETSQKSGTQQEYEAWQKGQQTGDSLAADLSSLKQGDFASVINRGLAGVRNVDSHFDEKRKEREKAARSERGRRKREKNESESFRPSIPDSLTPNKIKPGAPRKEQPGGTSGRPSSVARMRVERFELGPAGARMLARAIQRGLGSGGGGGGRGWFGRGGGGGGGGGLVGDMAEGTGRAASAIPVLGAAIGGLAAVVGMISSINQMRESAISAQGGSIGAVGLTDQGAGPALMNNAEFGSARLSAGQVTGDRDSSGLAASGGAFGIAQGLGGAAGARIFAQEKQFGLKGTASGTLLGAADVSGFGGLRRGRYAQEVAGMAENQVQNGFGRMDIRAFGELTAGLHMGGRGLEGESALSLGRNLQSGFQQRGGTLQNLALAARMGRGESYMKALAGAERGATRENMSGVHGLLGLDKMDPETRAIIEMQLSGSTATQAMGVAGAGGIFGASARGAGQVGARSAQSQAPESYRNMIGRQNQVDSILFGAENIAKVATEATTKLLQAADGFTSAVDDLIGKMQSML